MQVHCALLVAISFGLVQVVLCNAPMQKTQSIPSFLNTIGAMVPTMVSNVLPLVVMFSIGALLVPSLGMFCHALFFCKHLSTCLCSIGLSTLFRNGRQRLIFV